MGLKLGDVAPDFVGVTTQGPLQFHEYIGDSWCVFFAHPKDFTPVCTTELGYMARIQDEFTKRNVKLLGISIDTVYMHMRWRPDIQDAMGAEVTYPLVGDSDLSISKLYDLIHPNATGDSDSRTAQENHTARTLMVIGPDKRIKFMMVYPMSTGRHFDEVLRVIDSLQLTQSKGVATPANWVDGGDVIVPLSLNDDQARAQFPKGLRIVKPYLRYTPSP